MSENILEVKELKKHYEVKSYFGESAVVKALDGVSLSLKQKETLAVVGESGCGKSTLAKALMHIEPRTAGQIYIEGKNSDTIEPSDYRSLIQMIFQDPYGSINPRKKAWQIISEPLAINKNASKKLQIAEAEKWMEKVGLRKQLSQRYPHMFSGGQRQRIGIARSLVLQPKILICDEPVSALDVSIQAQVLNLLMDLQDQFNLSYLFISHDLSVVKHIADRVLVMYLGKVVEYGDKDQIFSNPTHPYTQALLASTPSIQNSKREYKPLEGELPSPMNPPTGCAFHKRCPLATDKCSKVTPVLEEKNSRMVACYIV